MQLPAPDLPAHSAAQACWNHKPQKRPAMPEVISELLNVCYNYLWDASGRNSIGSSACTTLTCLCLSTASAAPTLELDSLSPHNCH